MKHRVKLVAALLLGAALTAQALTLGRLRGAAWVGQPLEVVIPIQFDAAEESGNLCPQAEVFHADNRQDPSRVRITVEQQSQGAQVRVRSAVVVDEPVVTVYLRVGCVQSSTRRFVLLADMPAEVQPAETPAVAPAMPSGGLPGAAVRTAGPASPATEVTQVVASAPTPAESRAVRRSAERPGAPSSRAMTVTKRASAASSTQATVKRSTAAQRGVRPRLKLDSVDFLSDRIANLETPISFAPNEDALHNAQRVQALEEDIKALRQQAVRNEALMQGLRTQLAQAQADRTPNILIYTMGVLLVLCLAAVVLLWTRLRQVQRGAQAWWHDGDVHVHQVAVAETQPGPLSEQHTAVTPGTHPESSHGQTPASAPAPLTATPLHAPLPPASALSEFLAYMPASGGAAPGYSVTEMHDSNFEDMLAGNTHRRAVAAPMSSRVHSARFDSEAERDVRQQAEFFLSLGQTARAVQVLQKEVDESPTVGPQIFLDLLTLYHSLGQRASFDSVRQRFTHEFSARVPDFNAFKDEGRGLDSYPEILARITASWGTVSGRPTLEACILRDPATSASFDLAAFRELLLLHAIAVVDLTHAPPTATAVPLRGAIDLDLSERRPAQMPDDVDLPLPILPPVESDTAPVPTATSGTNMMDFDLPASKPKL